MSNEIFSIERSKKGVPCMWECGGGASNTGYSTIICDRNGNKKKPLYVRRSGSLSNDNHALIPVRVNDVIIDACHHRDDFKITVYRIKEIEKNEAVGEVINSFDQGEWTRPVGKFKEAVSAGKEKAECYHCREPFYIIYE